MKNFVKECRLALKLSRSDLAARSNVSLRTLSSLERGDTAEPKPPTKRKVNSGLGLPTWAMRFVFPVELNKKKPWAYHAAAQAEYCVQNEKAMLLPRDGVCMNCRRDVFRHPSLTMVDAITRRIFECPWMNCEHPFGLEQD